MKRIIGWLSNPFALTTINTLILFLCVSALRHLVREGFHTGEGVHDVLESWKGVATILLAFGVALEEQGALHKIFGIENSRGAIEKVCHDFGVGFVMLGVLLEVPVWLMKIPNEVFNTDSIEHVLLGLIALLGLASVWVQALFNWKLIRARS